MVAEGFVAGFQHGASALSGHAQSFWAELDMHLRVCQAAVMKTHDYALYMDACDLNGNCNFLVRNVYTPAAEWTARKASGLCCSMEFLDSKMEELHTQAKQAKNPYAAEELMDKLQALAMVREEFMKLVGSEVKTKDLKSDDRKHLAGSKVKVHAEPEAVHLEEEEVSA
ncbi:hypothetical protein BEWA_040360 [Theileria equi strain WA]|uniref:Uncharacterized protein n=1 Tax=Theileria equi strain WA TaxID=1537102 RepID=L1LFR0_THEEQ|nr:hypothetical protein BEWA_040360 [Theileria equi strain WA]EKX73998.1 hypothetical protein BEWA_040360 [Theileria equi strain WA]|eukprot:XP_004833450.1 hypothetical protein BEWA_040360 [Theileria equi strain WA]